MTVEDLAKKHLGVDLTQKAFWEEAIRLAVADAEEFLEVKKNKNEKLLLWELLLASASQPLSG